MTSRKEDERNEKIIRGLMKLPPNRKCINCNSIGPQYVCTNFWTFVCTACSGIHREFTHRVKSVSMAKFTSQEVDALQRGGNQRAREIFLKDWDTQLQRLPDSSNVDRIREFIKNAYVDRKYAGGRSSDKPPRDVQAMHFQNNSQKNNDDDTRRASSYHSYSQSPPYDNQYEDRRYGKQVGVLTRKPGSDRGLYAGKISSFVYSPGHSEQMYEDRSANEGSIGRASDYSVSSAGDPFRYDAQSPNFQKDGGLSSPPIQPFRDILIEDTRHRTTNMHPDANSASDRTPSSGSSGSFNSNSVSLKTINSGSLPEQSILVQQPGKSTFPSLPQSSSSAGVVSQDPFDLSLKQPPSSATSIDLFASITHQNSLTTNLEKNPSTSSFSENIGWATFDLPLPAASSSEAKHGPQSFMPLSHGISKGDLVPHLFTNSTMHQPSVNGSAMNVPYPSMFNQWNGSVNEVHTSTSLTNSQPWNAFGNSTVNLSQASFENLPQKSEPQISVYAPTSGTHIESSEVLEDLSNGFKRSTIEDLVPSLPFNGVISGSSFPPLPPMDGSPPLSHDQKSTNPFDLPHDSDLEPTSMFLDMNSLQTALPNPPFPLTYISEIPEPWFPQSSATPIVDAVPQGGLTYMVGQAPTSQLLNDHSQGPVASFGGNPFA